MQVPAANAVPFVRFRRPLNAAQLGDYLARKAEAERNERHRVAALAAAADRRARRAAKAAAK